MASLSEYAQEQILRARRREIDELNLSGQKLDSIPKEIFEFSHLRKLSLYENALTSISQDISRLSNLEEVDLSSNQLQEFPSGLKYLKKLQTLNISSNQIKKLPDFISELVSLRLFYVYNNRLLELPESIGELSELTEFDADANNLTSLPDSLQALTKLNALRVKDNPFTLFPKIIANIIALKSLSISFLRLTKFPEELFDLVHLTGLYLRGPDISVLSNKISQLVNLTRFSLAGGKTIGLPESIAELSELTFLRLNNNRIESLPESIAWLSQLIEIDVCNNRLAKLPDTIGWLSQLKKLNISGNQIVELPWQLSDLTKLTELSASRNQISSIETDFSQLTELRTLYLSYNKLTELPWSIARLTKLAGGNFSFDSNPSLVSPPSDVIKRGKQAIFSYLLTIAEQRETEPRPVRPKIPRSEITRIQTGTIELVDTSSDRHNIQAFSPLPKANGSTIYQEYIGSQQTGANNPTRILVLAANPKNTERLRLDEEVREIEDGLKRTQRREHYVLRSKWALRSIDFYRAILDDDPHIVHFSGHGTEDDGICFENEMGQACSVDGRALADIFKLFPKVECVILNACYSVAQAEAIGQYVKYVIGVKQGIGDKSAIEFVVAFYYALGTGKPIGFAYDLACAVIRLSGIPEEFTPKLIIGAEYTRPNSS